MSEQKLDTYTYAVMKGADFSVGIRGIEWVARCIVPGCSSQHDAFSVQPEGKQIGRWAGYGAWMCRKCWDPSEMVTVQYGLDRGTLRKRGWGSLADLVMRCEGMTYREAERFILEYEGAPIPLTERPVLTARKSDDVWFAEILQYLQDSQSVSEQDKELLHTYLVSRGLTLPTALQLGYGFSRDNVKLKDGTYRHIPFLVIPWYKDKAANTLYRKVNRRNLHTPLPWDEPKYKAIWQSENNPLYLGESLLTNKRPTFLVESELDAATVLQEAGDLVNVVGTGTAKGSRNAVNAARLRRQPFVFVAFDDDEDGEQASEHWMGELNATKCVRYKPLLHDANEMHTQGMSVRKWVEAGLAYFVVAPQPEQPQEEQPEFYEEQEPSSIAVCCRCGGPAGHASPSGDTYCTEHYQCRRGHVPHWRKHEEWGIWLCACFWEAA